MSVHSSQNPKAEHMTEKANVILPGKVEKIIESRTTDEPEKAQIVVEGADELYREIRIENAMTDEKGDKVCLKKGDEVDITVEARNEATTPRSESK